MNTKVNRTEKVQRMKHEIRKLKKFVRTLYDATDKHEKECRSRIARNEEACTAMVSALQVEATLLKQRITELNTEMIEYKRKKWYQFIER